MASSSSVAEVIEVVPIRVGDVVSVRRTLSCTHLKGHCADTGVVGFGDQLGTRTMAPDQRMTVARFIDSERVALCRYMGSILLLIRTSDLERAEPEQKDLL